MSESGWDRVQELFEAALARPVGERAAFLDAACDDSDLREQLDALLESDAESAAFLQPVTRPVDLPFEPLEAPEDPFLGRRVGAFEIESLVARGGMGAVYRANRVDQQFEQTVAIKILKRGLDTDEILRRFTIERQVLARLEHPHIARLYDGGATSEGLPYLIMELVDGEPIDEFCDRERLGIRDRIELFCKVCHAVQFAHQNLIVHRDLKPSNILVTPDGDPKLLDFGIAKVLDPEAFGDPAEMPLATVTQMRIMTPRYASPEQVRGEPATTSTDVYSLGVILYEMLCGRSPHPLSSTTPEEIEKIVCQREPTRPSVAVTQETSEDDTEAIVTARRTDVRRLKSVLSGDLETVTLKALAKEVGRRYSAPEKLADDLSRYLTERPILARPDTAWYRASKFIRRNVVSLSIVVIFLGLVLVSTVITVWQQLELGIQEEEIDRLADIKRVPDANRRAHRLWPIDPRRIDEYESWLRDFGHPLRERFAVHQEDLLRVQSRALPVDPTAADASLRFETSKDVLLNETLSAITESLEPFLKPEHKHAGLPEARTTGTLASIEWCLQEAREMKAPEGEWLAAWREVRSAIRKSSKYGGLDLSPQVGLWPLGVNERTGLFEFFDTRTGVSPLPAEPGSKNRWSIREDTGIVYVLLPAATATIGAYHDREGDPRHDDLAQAYEQPVKSVGLDAYFISKYEVTQAQWHRLAIHQNYYNPDYQLEHEGKVLYSGGWTHPVERVHWPDANDVLRRVNAQLPTEVQWEHAARGGVDDRWPGGVELSEIATIGNISDAAHQRLPDPPQGVEFSLEVNDGWPMHAPVGSFAPNGYGLHDTIGNVGEWCSDGWSFYATKFSAGTGARSEDEENVRMFRGGSFRTAANLSRVSARRWLVESGTSNDIGVRPIRRIDPAEWKE